MHNSGWVVELVALHRRSMDDLDPRPARLRADGHGTPQYSESLERQLTSEIMALRDEGVSDIVERRLTRACEILDKGVSPARLLRAGEGPLRDATYRTRNEDVAFELRQIRQTMIGLREGDL